MVLTFVKNRNRTETALDAKMALDAGIPQCQPAEQKHADRFSSTKGMCRSIRTKVYSIVLSSYFNKQKRPKISVFVQKTTSHERH